MHKSLSKRFTIPDDYSQQRLDVALAKCLPDYSRAQITQWIKSGEITVNGETRLPKNKVQGGEGVALEAELEILSDLPQYQPLEIIFEDAHLLVINKPKGCVVHPGAGNREGTLLNALLYYQPDLGLLPRAGIIHRLDKDTTGLMVVTKSLLANQRLIEDLKNRQVTRRYYAIVKGDFISGGTIDLPIGRHRTDRVKMAIVSHGKPAVTHYKVKQRFGGYTWLDVQLETGRTHQIRVHFSHHQHPLVGDQTYKARGILAANLSEDLRNTILAFPRPALHAYHLALTHPATGEPMQWSVPMPEDMVELVNALNEESPDAHRNPNLART